MPIKIPNSLPALKILEGENIFVMTESRALVQDIRPLRILILNLMPTKIETETQLIRLLGNSPLQIEIELLHTATHNSKNTPSDHLKDFYRYFDDIKESAYDGMIITGAPVETLPFDETDYWEEICTIMEWSKSNVYSTLHICWGAQAGLYYHFGVEKRMLPQKLSGVYRHKVLEPLHPLVRGFNDHFMIPHSRYTELCTEQLEDCDDLVVLAGSPQAGPAIIATKNGRQIFCTGHAEYDRYTLAGEYFRDVGRGLNPQVPENYFPNDDPDAEPGMRWRAHANLLFINWLNYYVYQQTPYDLRELIKMGEKVAENEQ